MVLLFPVFQLPGITDQRILPNRDNLKPCNDAYAKYKANGSQDSPSCVWSNFNAE